MSHLKMCVFIFCAAWGGISQAATISKLSTGTTGESNGPSFNPSISDDGRYIVFESVASNLILNDTNNVSDIFLVDSQANTMERVSLGLNGSEANGASTNPVISADGNYIAFESSATNLVNSDANNVIDIFVYDRTSGITTRVSVDSSGVEARSHSFGPSISQYGQLIAFYSLATNLVTGDTNRAIDVFVHNTATGSTERVSVSANGDQGNMDSWQPRISANGEFVSFSSTASNLVPNDTNSEQDIFLVQRQDGSITLVSNAPGGQASNGRSSYSAMSGDGSYVVFESSATNLIANDNNGMDDVFVFDRSQRLVSRVSNATNGGDADGSSVQPGISNDGRFIGFFSYASNLVDIAVNQIENVYIYDQQTGNMELLSIAEDGSLANNSSYNPSLNSNGQFVALFSLASNLVTPDTNNRDDVFLFDRGELNTPPVANAGNDANVVLGNNVILDGTGSFDPDGTPITLYQWQVVSAPENSTVADWTSNQATPTFVPDLTGVFVISLIVNDGTTSSTPDQVFVTVSENLPPVAIITSDVTEGYAPLQVQFDGSNSYDPESSPITWLWNFGDGTTSSEVNPVHVYNDAGSFVAELVVTDEFGNQGQADLVISVSAVNKPPQILDLSVSPSTGPAPLLSNLSVQVSDPENDPLSIIWELGDGTVVYDVLALDHTYSTPGDYHGSVTVSDGTSSSLQTFVVSVNSDFVITDTYYKIHVRHDKLQWSQFRFSTQFIFDGSLAEDDIIALNFANLDIFEVKFGAFRMIKTNVYVYKSRKIMVLMDFNRNKMRVFKQRVFLNQDDFKPYAGIVMTFGSHTAVEEIKLTKQDHCYKSDGREERYQNCSVSVLKNSVSQ
jgi:PKD repeat protein